MRQLFIIEDYAQAGDTTPWFDPEDETTWMCVDAVVVGRAPKIDEPTDYGTVRKVTPLRLGQYRVRLSYPPYTPKALRIGTRYGLCFLLEMIATALFCVAVAWLLGIAVILAAL